MAHENRSPELETHASSKAPSGVALPNGQTASSFFHAVLREAAARYPDVFRGADLPESARVFKKTYGDALVRFELARAASRARVEIARFIVHRTQEQLRFAQGEGGPLLREYLATRAPAPALQAQRWGAAPALVPSVPFEGREYRRRDLLELGELLRKRAHMTRNAAAALSWIVEHAEANGGVIDLRGQRFAIMGAGAEISPATDWLRAGAEVLWIDIADPVSRLSNVEGLAGTLVRSEENDLLKRPREVIAAIDRFSEAGPVHVCAFAYAGGASQEWRLGAAMNAIARELAAERVRSIACFVSPTSPANVCPEDLDAAAQRASRKPAWQAALAGAGALPRPGQLRSGDTAVARAIVPIQGLSYQAAQYIAKILSAECYGVYGLQLESGERRPVTVSANVAGITRTRSLSHPVFQAAFIGAPAFDVQIFDPETTRALSGLLILHDLLNPNAKGAADASADPSSKARALLSQQVHGGIYCLPYALEQAIQTAALIGMAKKPSLLMRLAR